MNPTRLLPLGLVLLAAVGLLPLAGCGDAAEKQARQAERERAKAQEETARRMLQSNPGAYTPAPIDMSLEPLTPEQAEQLRQRRQREDEENRRRLKARGFEEPPPMDMSLGPAPTTPTSPAPSPGTPATPTPAGQRRP